MIELRKQAVVTQPHEILNLRLWPESHNYCLPSPSRCVHMRTDYSSDLELIQIKPHHYVLPLSPLGLYQNGRRGFILHPLPPSPHRAPSKDLVPRHPRPSSPRTPILLCRPDVLHLPKHPLDPPHLSRSARSGITALLPLLRHQSLSSEDVLQSRIRHCVFWLEK